MILLIDNYDSFTYNLTDYLSRLGHESMVLKNDETDGNDILNYQFDRLLISPGPNTPLESGNLMSIIEATYLHFPILGVCLGHQALGQFFGAKLVHSRRPMHGKVSELIHNGQGVFSGLPQRFKVCRYHSLLLQDLDNTELISTAHTEEGENMGMVHSKLPLTGIQFHPEAILTEYGLDMLANWLKQTSHSAA